MSLLVYGANGFTGRLVAELASSRGEKPLLAGRSADKVRPLAERLGLPWRAFPLEAPDLAGARAVLHCAGPFSLTSRPMVDACLRAGAHYLDITGEVSVFESIYARDAEAKERGVVLMPGTGVDVVPSDCLAAMLKERLPGAVRLELALTSRGPPSAGTTKTAVEHLGSGGLARRGGKLVPVPLAHATRDVPFSHRTMRAMAIPWGDVSSAWRSTGIPDITVYLGASRTLMKLAKLTPLVAPLLRIGGLRRFVQRQIEKRVPGPTAEQRARGRVHFWGRATDASGNAVEATLDIPEGYSFTAEAALACAGRVLAGGVAPGAWTPAQAFGATFVTTLPGVSFRVA